MVICVFVSSCGVLKLLDFEAEAAQEIFLPEFKLLRFAFVITDIADPVLLQFLIGTGLAARHRAQTARLSGDIFTTNQWCRFCFSFVKSD